MTATEISESPKTSTNKGGAIRRELRKDGICTLTFDQPDSSANLFNRATLREIDEHIAAVRAMPGVRGVVFLSAKKSIFIAGADLRELSRAEDLRELIELGQSVFNRIAALPVPTVAAIHGACVGGGTELALACDYRVASPDAVTRIGLPETQLGILPAWGGSTRLPRLIGLPAALDVILGARTLRARQAAKLGLVDALAPRENFLLLAEQNIRAGKHRAVRHPLTNNRVAATTLRGHLRGQLLRKTRGHYPALTTVLDVITRGVSELMDTGLARERAAVIELANTETCKNLVRVFFLTDRAKKVASPRERSRVSRAAVIGAGVMGAGIAQWLSARELTVTLRDVRPEFVSAGIARIAQLYKAGTRRGLFTAHEARRGMDRIFPVAGEASLRHAELVIEAVVEKMEVKKEVFRALEKIAGPDAVLATNTSALSISEIASAVADPGRVVGIHFFNPVHQMKLVEINVGRATSERTLERAKAFVLQIGKLPVVVRDSPAFLVNRILVPYLIEAGRLFEAGAAVADIDEAMLDFGMPMGPLRLIDEVGVDIANDVAATLAAHFPERMSVPPSLSRMMTVGLLGRKKGRGFYIHEKKRATPNPQAAQFQTARARPLTRGELQQRMVFAMLNEAARCLEEKIVAAPEDVDFAMIMGAGFAPFRGGPLRYADSIGIARLVDEMSALAESEPRFAPCRLLRDLAASGGRFYEH